MQNIFVLCVQKSAFFQAKILEEKRVSSYVSVILIQDEDHSKLKYNLAPYLLLI